MGSQFSKQVKRRKAIANEKRTLLDLLENSGEEFPGSDYHPPDRKNWMFNLDPTKIGINQIVWPGTHDSATNRIGIPCITRPFAQCQSLSIYNQLVKGTRVLDLRVQKDRRLCHGIIATYSLDVAIKDIKKFLSETNSEVIIVEVRTEFGQDDPPDLDKYLVDQLGEYLIPHDENIFQKTVAELLPKRIICVWKPRKSANPKNGDPLWNTRYLKDNWIDTDLPCKKFESNLKHLSAQPPLSSRKFFYRVENTVTPQPDNPVVCVKPVTGRIQKFARSFINQCLYERSCRKVADFLDRFYRRRFRGCMCRVDLCENSRKGLSLFT